MDQEHSVFDIFLNGPTLKDFFQSTREEFYLEMEYNLVPLKEINFCPLHSVLFSLVDELSGGHLPKYVEFDEEGRLGVSSFGTTTYRFASLINYYQCIALKSAIKEDTKWRNLSDNSIHEIVILSEQFKTLDDYRKMFFQYDMQAFEDALWKYLNKHYAFENGNFKQYRKIN
mgnify:CR=1 FL=1